MSIVFDRAVEYYDRTRAMPPDIADSPCAALIRETNLHPDARVLEMGIGTGRIALTLARRIHRVTGVDLSLPMMGVLQNKLTAPAVRIDLAQADVVRLPFARETFDLIYAVHLFHLVAGWRDAVAEVQRALKRGGYFGASWNRREADAPHILLTRELHRLVEEQGVDVRRTGAQSDEEVFAELEAWHGALRVVDVVEWTETTNPARMIERIGQQLHSETWMIPREVMEAVIPRLTEWAQAQFGALEREVTWANSFHWLIARKE